MPGAIVLSNRVASSGMSLWELLRMLLGESKQARIIAAIIAAWAANKLRKLLVGNGIPRADFPKQTPRGMLRPYGWGYRDSGFQMSEGKVRLIGNRYLFSGESFPKFLDWAMKNAAIDPKDEAPVSEMDTNSDKRKHYGASKKDAKFIAAITKSGFEEGKTLYFDEYEPAGATTPEDGADGHTGRVFHAHGHTMQDVFKARYGGFERIPDCVIFPEDEAMVEAAVGAAKAQSNVVLIPFGGGTTVSGAVNCPSQEEESRMIVVVDMRRMTRITIDRENMCAEVEAGTMGTDMDERLARYGVCVGHEPDSCEFSTVGGWIATRASGMKKNIYGNIEDIVLSVNLVTPNGVLSRRGNYKMAAKVKAEHQDLDRGGRKLGSTQLAESGVQPANEQDGGAVGGNIIPRMSAGMDPTEIALGSEGTLGIVTKVKFKLRDLPKAREFGAIIFKTMEEGVGFMREVARKHAAPASIRLVDNAQFVFGQALKPAGGGMLHAIVDAVKKVYVVNISGFDPNNMCACTLLMEGDDATVEAECSQIYSIAAKHGGMKADRNNGIRGYFLTYSIAYLRDFGLGYWFMAESFETSIAWSAILPMTAAVKDKMEEVAHRFGVKDMGSGSPVFYSARVTQTYDTGAAVYFYFGFRYKELQEKFALYKADPVANAQYKDYDPLNVFHVMENECRDVIMTHGGSCSHHHGIGKIRKVFLEETVGPQGVSVMKAVKSELDPQNIFGVGNLCHGDWRHEGSAVALDEIRRDPALHEHSVHYKSRPSGIYDESNTKGSLVGEK